MATFDDADGLASQLEALRAENLALRAELVEVELVHRQQASSSERGAFDVDSTAAGETANSEAQRASTGREFVTSLASAGETPGSHEQHAGSDLDPNIDAKSVGTSSDGQDVTPNNHARHATSTIEQGAGGNLSSALQSANTDKSGDIATRVLITTMVSETEDERIGREMQAVAQDEEERGRIYQENKRQQQEARAVPEASRRQLRSVLLEPEAEHLEEKTKTFDRDERKLPTASAKGITIPSVTPTSQLDGGLRSQTVQAPFDLADREADNRGDLEEHGLLCSFVGPLVSVRSSQFAAFAIVKFRYKKGQF
ncbi:hypothetical protein LTR10_009966 [Elasticomyces elasticus]|nr:hypothetical protein LTR10_009966 [Elasticomyces elasticus]KAK4970258.1 hypothetical protein LTR42_008425 [Elasticomyces elasticus]